MRTEILPTQYGPVLLTAPNETTQARGFYVSYNCRDAEIYGCDTTALVVGQQMDRFYILNGDHQKQYAALLKQGFDACFGYFCDHITEMNKYSDKLPTLSATLLASMS